MISHFTIDKPTQKKFYFLQVNNWGLVSKEAD